VVLGEVGGATGGGEGARTTDGKGMRCLGALISRSLLTACAARSH
jgi:hypothetical protein